MLGGGGGGLYQKSGIFSFNCMGKTFSAPPPKKIMPVRLCQYILIKSFLGCKLKWKEFSANLKVGYSPFCACAGFVYIFLFLL